MRKNANSPDMTAINVLQGMRPRGSSVEMHTFLPTFLALSQQHGSLSLFHSAYYRVVYVYVHFQTVLV